MLLCISFIYVPAPHATEVLCDSLVQCLLDWNLDRKLSTITLDNCSTNDAMIQLIFAKIPPSRFYFGWIIITHEMLCSYTKLDYERWIVNYI